MQMIDIEARLNELRRHHTAGTLGQVDFSSADLSLVLNRLDNFERCAHEFFDSIEQCNANLYNAGRVHKTSRQLCHLLGRNPPI